MSYMQTEKAIYLGGTQETIPCPTTVLPLNAGDVIAWGFCAAVALAPINVNNDPPGHVAVSGKFKFLKAPGVAIAWGAEVEWDTTQNVAITATGGGYTDNLSLGKCINAALATDTTVDVLLNPYASSAAGA